MKKAATINFKNVIASTRIAVDVRYPQAMPWLKNYVRKTGEQEEKT